MTRLAALLLAHRTNIITLLFERYHEGGPRKARFVLISSLVSALSIFKVYTLVCTDKGSSQLTFCVDLVERQHHSTFSENSTWWMRSILDLGSINETVRWRNSNPQSLILNLYIVSGRLKLCVCVPPSQESVFSKSKTYVPTVDNPMQLNFAVPQAGVYTIDLTVQEVVGSGGGHIPVNESAAVIQLPPSIIKISPGVFSPANSLIDTPLRVASYTYSHVSQQPTRKEGVSLAGGPAQHRFADVQYLFRIYLYDASGNGRWGCDKVTANLCLKTEPSWIKTFSTHPQPGSRESDLTPLSSEQKSSAGGFEFQFRRDIFACLFTAMLD